MKILLKSIVGPKLYKIHRDGPVSSVYTPGIMEKWGDNIISMGKTIWSIAYFTFPLCCIYIYNKGLIYKNDQSGMIKIFGAVGCIITLSYIMRGLGRATNSKYTEFLKIYSECSADPARQLTKLRKYDFDYTTWPVSYSVEPKVNSTWKNYTLKTSEATRNLGTYEKIPIQVLAYLATHTFGLRMVYPGSLGIINYLFDAALLMGRSQLVEEFDGIRAKILTADNNYIDTMFVDHRYNKTGETLVICCEGNSGFYEVGIMTTPIKAGFSALGWNHPGFAWSTGNPYPAQEQNAIDAVMQYAINELGFEVQNIILFGWSIGGYTATWAAVQYPGIKALILDATFDDLLPLALNQMPKSWNSLVQVVIRSYVDLNISELLKRYQGPVAMVRRTKDEIICLQQGKLSTNRGNALIIDLIKNRHENELDDPEIIEYAETYICLTERQRHFLLTTQQPVEQRTIALNYIQKYMHDYSSTHCTPLPVPSFKTVLEKL